MADPNPIISRTLTTRLAPSPTGALHLGNARTFLVNWALARKRGWRIVLRIEDLDGPRVKPEAIPGVVETLRWLGLDWDQGPLVQSADLEPCRDALRRLVAGQMAYRCDLTRGEIEAAASAPQQGSGESVFPASLRPQGALQRGRSFDDELANWRFATPTTRVDFRDEFAGAQSHTPAQTIGDFVVWTKRATPAYQLAVVVDDHRQGVTHVVRGDDLLDSAARQMLLYRALGFLPEPTYCHLPLVVGPDGRRLAKRHGDTKIDSLRQAGVRRNALVGLVAHWCGIMDHPADCTPERFASMLDLSRVPRGPIVLTPEHHAWLRQQT